MWLHSKHFVTFHFITCQTIHQPHIANLFRISTRLFNNKNDKNLAPILMCDKAQFLIRLNQRIFMNSALLFQILALSAHHSIPFLTFLSHRSAKVRIRTKWPTSKKATSVEGSNVEIFVHNKLQKFQRTATCLSQCMTFLCYRLIVLAHHFVFNFN